MPAPEKKNPTKKANREQAVAVEPPMIAALEERIQFMYEAGDPRWCLEVQAHHESSTGENHSEHLPWLLP